MQELGTANIIIAQRCAGLFPSLLPAPMRFHARILRPAARQTANDPRRFLGTPCAAVGYRETRRYDDMIRGDMEREIARLACSATELDREREREDDGAMNAREGDRRTGGQGR